MALPKRKIPQPSAPELGTDGRKALEVRVVRTEKRAQSDVATEDFNKETEDAERSHLGDYPHLRSPRWKERVFEEFRRSIEKIRTTRPENLRFYVVNPGNDTSLWHAFVLDPDAENVTALHATRAETNTYEFRGYRCKKGFASWHQEAERADVVVIEDEDVRITRYLLRNVEFGGHLLVPMKHVNAVRAAGRYDCVGIIEVHGSNAVMRENIGPEFWKKSEVRTEEAFRNAKTDEIDS